MIRRPTAPDLALLALMAAMWGSSFLAIKLAVETLAPATVAAGRIVIGAVVVLLVLGLRGQRLPRGLRRWWRLAWIALFNMALPFYLISWAEQTIDSGLAAILMATSPLTTLLLSHALTHDDRLSGPKLAGVALGFAGVLVVVGVQALAGLGANVVAQLAVVGAAACYAISGVLARKLHDQDSGSVTTGVLLCGTILAVPACLWIDRPWTAVADPDVWLAVLYLGVVPTGLAYLIRFHLIARCGASFVAMSGYLVPVFGVLLGVALLGEALPAAALLALAMILAGINLTRLDPSRVRRLLSFGRSR
ncbi:MAG: DMT family transporter [Alphaproteobacteria bacterium]|nr:DMT family transporter [Alphaproteobacteria bacterium]